MGTRFKMRHSETSIANTDLRSGHPRSKKALRAEEALKAAFWERVLGRSLDRGRLDMAT